MGNVVTAAATPQRPRAPFRMGLIASLPFLMIVTPFSVIFGVVAREAGLDLVQTFVMTFLVIAGASQFTALALLQEQAPVFVVVATALAVNMRMAMYSLAMVPHLGGAPLRWRALIAYLMVDQAFAMSHAKFEKNPHWEMPDKIAFYMGSMIIMAPLWYAGTMFGAIVGEALPDSWQLPFAVPVCFIALVAPLLRSLPYIIAAAVSACGSLLFVNFPWGLGLITAAICAVIIGAASERWLERRQATNRAAI